MNQSDLSIDEAADKHLLRLGYRFEDCVNAMALRVCPPTTVDRFARDDLGKSRCRSPRRGEHHTVFSDKGQRVRGGRRLFHDDED